MTVTLRRDPGHLSRGSLEGRRPRSAATPGPHPSRLAEFIIGPAEGRTRWLAPQDDGCWSVLPKSSVERVEAAGPQRLGTCRLPRRSGRRETSLAGHERSGLGCAAALTLSEKPPQAASAFSSRRAQYSQARPMTRGVSTASAHFRNSPLLSGPGVPIAMARLCSSALRHM